MILRGSLPLLAGVMSKVHIGYEVEMLSEVENMLCDEIIDYSQLIFKVPDMTLIDHVALDFTIFILKKFFCVGHYPTIKKETITLVFS